MNAYTITPMTFAHSIPIDRAAVEDAGGDRFRVYERDELDSWLYRGFLPRDSLSAFLSYIQWETARAKESA